MANDIKWESEWWSTCQNTYNEEEKQLVYASRMGLNRKPDVVTPYRFDLQGKSILDIGGGPISLLLKCVNGKGAVADPIAYPEWVLKRYACAGIKYIQVFGEDIVETGFDEVWIYNVLTHVADPAKIIRNARAAGKIVRIYEWLNTAPSIGHPHSLKEDLLNQWLGGVGKVERFNTTSCKGTAYFGVFMGSG